MEGNPAVAQGAAENGALQVRGETQPAAELTVEEVLSQIRKVHSVMEQAMQDGQHYGVIPGTDKPTLLQPGAQKLALLFQLSTRYRIEREEHQDGHRTYEVVCELHHPLRGFAGEGLGVCSTLESKYRWRKAGRVCPECGSDAVIKGRAEYGGGWLCFRKKGGCGAKYNEGDQAIEGQATGRAENQDIADAYNTCLKMAKKRAMVDAILQATAASDVFPQDVEEQAAPIAPVAPVAPVAAAPAPQAWWRDDPEAKDIVAQIGQRAQTLGPERTASARAFLQEQGRQTGAPDELVGALRDYLAVLAEDTGGATDGGEPEQLPPVPADEDLPF